MESNEPTTLTYEDPQVRQPYSLTLTIVFGALLALIRIPVGLVFGFYLLMGALVFSESYWNRGSGFRLADGTYAAYGCLVLLLGELANLCYLVTLLAGLLRLQMFSPQNALTSMSYHARWKIKVEIGTMVFLLPMLTFLLQSSNRRQSSSDPLVLLLFYIPPVAGMIYPLVLLKLKKSPEWTSWASQASSRPRTGGIPV